MSNDYESNLVWLCAGTTVVQHVAVCLLMPVSCVLFDAQLVGELITPIKSSTASPPKNKTNPKKPHKLPF